MVDFSQSKVYFRCIVAKITISPPNAIQSMCCWLPMLVQCCLLLLLQFYSSVNFCFQSKVYFFIVAKITISPPNAMLSMCCSFSMLVQCSLLLLLQIHWTVNG